MLLFGRVTYEGMASYWPSQKGEIADFMNTIPKIVFSRTLEKAEWSNTRLMRGDAAPEVSRLKRQPGGNLTIFGSAQLCSTLTEHGLIDEYQLGVVPVVLGRGTPLFKPRPNRMRLTLIEARPTKSGCVILRYRPDGTAGRPGRGLNADPDSGKPRPR